MRPESQHIYSQLLVDVVVLVGVEVVVDVEVVPKLKAVSVIPAGLKCETRYNCYSYPQKIV